MPVRGSKTNRGAAKPKPSPGRGSQRLRQKEEEEARRRAEEEVERLRREEEEEASQEADAIPSDADSDNAENGENDGSDEEDGDSDDDVEESDEESSESSDEENAEEEGEEDDSRSRSRIVGPVRTQGQGQGKKRAPASKKASAKKAPTSSDSNDLFSMVKEGRYAFKLIADDWIDDYKKEKGGAMTSLIQFIVRSAGCKATVTQEMVVSRNYDETFKKLTQEFGEESAEYPLIMTGTPWKKFKNNFVDFLDYLIIQCQHTLLYDGFFLDHFLPWLMTMTTSQVQAFRHTSTLAALKLCSSFITVAQNVQKEVGNCQRTLDIERQKSGNRRTAERIEVLEGQLDERKDEVSELEEHMQKIFSGVFVMRYRDVKPDIRSLCIQGMGEWMLTYSSTFLADMYLKYIGWMLYDQVSEVRTMALTVLERLYYKDSLHENLYLFTQKFKNRIVEMVMDVDDATGSHAVRVACVLLNMDVLDSDNCEQIYQLVFVRPRALAHAAGAFLVKFLFNEERLATRQKEEEEASQKSSPKKRGRGAKKAAALSETQFKLKELAKFFLECQAASTVEYFIDSIWPHMEELKAWEAYSSLLQEDHGLSTEEEACLVDMMSTAIQRAVGGLGPAFRAHRKPVMSKKDKQALEEQKSEVSSHFMACLPALLGRFDADAEKVIDLVRIPKSFDLQLYSELRLQKQLSDLLTALHRIVFKHSSAEVFEECAMTLEYLLGGDHALQSNVDVAVENLLDSMAAEAKQAHTQYMKKKSRTDQDTFALTVHLRRLSCVSRFVDTSKWEFFTELQALLALGCEDPDAMGNELLVECVMCLGSGLLRLITLLRTQESPSELKNTVRLLRSHLQEHVSRCDELIAYSAPAVQMQTFCIMADVLVSSHALKSNKDAQIAALVPDVDAGRQDRCREFIIASVLLHTDPEPAGADDDEDLEMQEERSQALVDRRRALAAFCKLVAFDVFQLRFAAPILTYYIRAFPDYGDVIKHFLAKLREANHKDCARTMVLALQLLSEEIRFENDGVVDRQSKEWVGLKELAKRFGLSVGVDASRTAVRESVVTIHREGIVYALSRTSATSQVPPAGGDADSPSNLDFFDILAELVFRLMPMDRNKSSSSILNFLDERLKESSQVPAGVRTLLSQAKWQPLGRYRSALSATAASRGGAAAVSAPSQATEQVLDDFDDAASDASAEPAAKRKAVGRARKSSTSRGVGGMAAAKQASDGVWLQRPSEAEVRQQKMEKARGAAVRARSNRGSGRPSKTNAVPEPSRGKQKRRREPSSSEEEDAGQEEEEQEEEEEMAGTMEDSEDVRKSSQVSWLSSQPKRKKPDVRRSYGASDVRSPRAPSSRSRISRPNDDDVPLDYVTTSPSMKPGRRARRPAQPLPESIFDDAMGGDDSGSELNEGIF